MLVKLRTENSCLNTDYMVSLSYRHTKDKYDILAGMIDGKILVLATYDTKEEAINEYNRILTEANKKRD